MSANNETDLTGLVNLAQRILGAEVLSATDDFFAEKENLLDPSSPKFIEGKFTDRGKWMDGWESRRRRQPGHDHCVVRLCRGSIHAIDVDTAHFTGNYPEQAMVEACDCASDPDDSTVWTEIVPRSNLNGDSNHIFTVDSSRTWSHVRLNIYPDGGVARLRIYGRVHNDWSQVEPDEAVDLAAMENGGAALACSDEHFGTMWNLLSPGRAKNMGDGWETARRRGEGHDWVIIELGVPGAVNKIVADTLHFKGNYPASCTVKAIYAPGARADDLVAEEMAWRSLLENVELSADTNHSFTDDINNVGVVSHVKLEIFPDGGVGRLRIFGTPALNQPLALTPIALDADNFKPYGDVVDIEGRPSRSINQGYADRFENLAALDLTDGGSPALSVFKARPVKLPFSVTHMERHPKSSQLFIPKGRGRFLVLVAEGSQQFNPANLRLFVSNGRQGVNYKRGVWHHFLMALENEQEFIVLDRSDPDDNTAEVELAYPYPIITAFQ